jgi:hypothetical protein
VVEERNRQSVVGENEQYVPSVHLPPRERTGCVTEAVTHHAPAFLPPPSGQPFHLAVRSPDCCNVVHPQAGCASSGTLACRNALTFNSVCFVYVGPLGVPCTPVLHHAARAQGCVTRVVCTSKYEGSHYATVQTLSRTSTLRSSRLTSL